MWKKHVCQCLGWAVLGGGACLAGYCAYKYDIFGKSNLLTGKENLKEIKDMEIDISESLKPNVSENEEQQKEPAWDSLPQTPQENVETNSTNDSTSKNSQSNVDHTVTVISNSSNETKTTDKNTIIFYEFVASESESDDYWPPKPDQKYALDTCENDDTCTEAIVNLKIYSDVTNKKIMQQETFIDDQKYWMEIQSNDSQKLLNKKIKITWNSVSLTTIKDSTLKEFVISNK